MNKKKSANKSTSKSMEATKILLTNRVGNATGRAEMKVYDIYTSSSVSTTPFVVAFNGMPTGTAYNERLGRSIHIHAITIRYAFVPADSSNVMRVTVGNWASGSASFSGVISNSWDNAIIPFAGGIYLDKLVGFPASVNATSATYPSVVFEKTIVVNKPMVWDPSGPTVVTKNHFFVLLQSDSSAVVHPTAHGFARIYYTDE